MQTTMKSLRLFASAAGCALLLSGCDRMLEFEPGDVILAEDAINNADDLQRMLNSNYDVLANLLNGRQQCIAELLTDNMARPYSSLDYTAVWNRETNFFTPTTGGLYTDFYYAIYRANVVVDSFDLVEDLDDVTRLRLEAESRFVRAVCHWYLVKMWAYPYGYTPTIATWACPCAPMLLSLPAHVLQWPMFTLKSSRT